MHCTFVNVWEVCIGDGYTLRPKAYFLSKDQAEMWIKKQVDCDYFRISDKTVEAIQVGDRTWLLGSVIDLDHAEERERERLINSAKSKLTSEELAALLKK